MTCSVLMGTLNLTHSLTHSVAVIVVDINWNGTASYPHPHRWMGYCHPSVGWGEESNSTNTPQLKYTVPPAPHPHRWMMIPPSPSQRR